MIRSIAGTLINRFAVMAFAMATVLLNTNFLGDAGQGEVALLNLTILVLLSISHFITGGAVVYLVPRMDVRAFWKPAYAWAALIALAGWGVLELWHLVPEGYAWVVAVLTFCQSLFTFHMHVLLGQQKVRLYNAVQLTYAGSLAVLLAVFYIGLGEADLWCYATCAGLSMVAAFVVSLAAVGKHLFGGEALGSKAAFQAIWNYGRWSQLGNVFQNLSYRAPYAILERTVTGGTAMVGVFSIHTYASEAIWNVGKSLSLVQYSRLSNLSEAEVRTRITLAFLKISAIFTLIPCIVLWIFPSAWWEALLGEGFGWVSTVVSVTVIGIFLNALTMVVSHHFAGIGKHKFNAWSSLVGCLAVIGVGMWLIPSDSNVWGTALLLQEVTVGSDPVLSTQEMTGGASSVIPGWHVTIFGLPLIGAAWAFVAGMVVQAIVSAAFFIRTEKGRLRWHGLRSDWELLRGQSPNEASSNP